MQSLVGDRYYDRNERLGEFLSSLAKVADRSGLPPARAQYIRQLIPSLRNPFLFVVAGEVNSGKSTFLNALFGDDFCNVAPTPTTECIYYFKYAEKARDVRIDDSFIEFYRPASFLRDFHIVDTPGTNSIAEGHQEITERFIPMADLVIFVFPITNPWGASTWDFISRIYEGWLKQVVFVVQQTDVRTQQEVDAILEHMRVTSKERLGREFPTFAVSAKKAMAGKTSEHGQAHLLEESGFAALEEHISEVIGGSPLVTRKTRSVLRSARAVMDEVDKHLAAEETEMARAGKALEGIEKGIDEESARAETHLAEAEAAALGHFAKTRLNLASMFEQGSGFFASLKGTRRLVPEIEKELPTAATRIANEAAESMTRSIEAGLPDLHRHLADQCRKEFGSDIAVAGKNDKPAWMEAREGFREDIEERLQSALVDTETVGRLESAVGRLSGTSRTSLVVFIAAIAATIGGFFSQSQPLFIAALGVAVLALPVGALLNNRRKRKARGVFDERMDRAVQSMERKLAEARPEYLQRYFRRISSLCDPARKNCEEKREHFEPLITEMKNLRETLATLEEEAEETEKAREDEAVS